MINPTSNGGHQGQEERDNMRFLMMVMLSGDEARKYETGYMGEPDDYVAMAAFNEEMQQAGVMVSGDGLHPTSQGGRVEFGKGDPLVIDGPFVESKELLGGYWIIETATKQEALDWARRAPMMPGDALVLRRIMEMDEYTPEQQEAAGFSQS